MRLLLLPALAALALALPDPASAASCGSLAAQRTRLAAEYQMNQAVIGDWLKQEKRKRKKSRRARIGRTAAGVGLNLLLPFPLGAAASLGAQSAVSAATGEPMLTKKKQRGSPSIAALARRQRAIAYRLGRTERARGCDFYAGRSVGRGGSP
jgi:hypothetical protein